MRTIEALVRPRGRPDWTAAKAGSSYFTDGARLYRVVSWLERPVEPQLAKLEDCRSLECLLVSTIDLARMHLRPVASAPDPAPGA